VASSSYMVHVRSRGDRLSQGSCRLRRDHRNLVRALNAFVSNEWVETLIWSAASLEAALSGRARGPRIAAGPRDERAARLGCVRCPLRTTA
jgi:hypothetical protein